MNNDIAVSKSFEILKDAIKTDSDYAWSWHCNIAMSFQDEGVTHELANRGAARFMQLCFDVDMTQFDQWKAFKQHWVMDKARQLAAQCWCDPETEHIQMDPLLVEAFAKRLVLFYK